MEEMDESTLLLPVVEAGNLGKEYIDKIYYVRVGERKLTLYPLLSVRKSLQEMYQGSSEYGHRLFYLANGLSENILNRYVDRVLPLGDVQSYFEEKNMIKHQANTFR